MACSFLQDQEVSYAQHPSLLHHSPTPLLRPVFPGALQEVFKPSFPRQVQKVLCLPLQPYPLDIKTGELRLSHPTHTFTSRRISCHTWYLADISCWLIMIIMLQICSDVCRVTQYISKKSLSLCCEWRYLIRESLTASTSHFICARARTLSILQWWTEFLILNLIIHAKHHYMEIVFACNNQSLLQINSLAWVKVMSMTRISPEVRLHSWKTYLLLERLPVLVI